MYTREQVESLLLEMARLQDDNLSTPQDITTWLNIRTPKEQEYKTATEDKKAPVDAETFLQSKDIWHHPMVMDRNHKNGFEIADLLTEFGSQERNRAIQEFEKIIEKIKHGLKQMVDEAPNMRSPDGRFGQRKEDRNHGMEQAAKLALVMVKLIEEKELSKLKK